MTSLPTVSDVESLRRAISAALEQLEMGDQRGAELTLLDALDHVQPADKKWRCKCGRRFQYRGELEGHRFRCLHAIFEDAA